MTPSVLRLYRPGLCLCARLCRQRAARSLAIDAWTVDAFKNRVNVTEHSESSSIDSFSSQGGRRRDAVSP